MSERITHEQAMEWVGILWEAPPAKIIPDLKDYIAQQRQREADMAELERENEELRARVNWLERNSIMKTPARATISDYLEAKKSGEWETPCPAREDGQHCNCWYDGKACCACGDSPSVGQSTACIKADALREFAAKQSNEVHRITIENEADRIERGGEGDGS